MNQNHFADGHLVPTQDFDYDAIDRGNPLAAEMERDENPMRSADAVALGKLFGIILTYGGTDSAQFFILANVLAFVIGIHPNQGAGGVEIASGLGIKKANWFRRVNQMRSVLNSRGSVLPKIAGMWSDGARQTIKKKTTQYHEQRKRTKNGSGAIDIDRFSRAIKESGISY